jgi:hypothetical protein
MIDVGIAQVIKYAADSHESISSAKQARLCRHSMLRFVVKSLPLNTRGNAQAVKHPSLDSAR